MFPASRTTHAQQHVQHSRLPSNIRTRSQKQHPLSPVDLSASPLKEAIRNHNLNHQSFLSPPAEPNDHAENIGSRFPDDDADDELLLSPSRKKRASSPSFVANNHSEKRVRVLGESTRANSVGRRHSEESLGTPRKESAPTPLSLKRTVSSGSPDKKIVHLDLTKVPPSPSKYLGSPSRTFHITMEGGRTMGVPITPGRKASNVESGFRARTPGVSSSMAGFQVHVDGPNPSSNSPSMSTSPSNSIQRTSASSDKNELQMALLKSPAHGHDNNAAKALPSVTFQFQSTPMRPRLLGDGLFSGDSPLTPLPPTPHPGGSVLPRPSAFPQSISNQNLRPIPSQLFPAASTSTGSLKPGQTSPTKSRIPIPTSSSVSRLPRPSSSLSITGIATSGPSSPARSPLRRPLKPKPRINRKPKSEVRSRAPITRLAAKRGIRRTSSVIGLRAGTSSSTGLNLSQPSENPEPSTSTNAFEIDRRKPNVIPSGDSKKNAPTPRTPSLLPQSTSVSASPSKPTPLSALSTALQKLLAHPPAAPAQRPRPNTSMGFLGPGHTTVQPRVSESTHTQKDADGDVKTPGKSPQRDVGIPRPQTSLGHSRPSGTPHGLGKMGLPVRRLAPPAGAGGSAQKTGAPFASKQTTLSTVPASPARSAVPAPEDAADSNLRMVPNEVLDVDAWVPNHLSNNGKGKAKEGTTDIEFTVPLADESPTKRQVPVGLISPSRRASQASLSLTKSLSLPRALPAVHPTIVRSASTSTALPYNPRTPVKTRGRTKPPPPAPEASTKQSGPMGGKRSNARMPGSLDVLRDCVIFVDVRTEEGEDAGALFIDMLRGLGARILAKPGKSCTHLVYKDGSPMTITKYKLLPEPRPLPVSIGWVVECVEKREHVEETRFLVNLDEIGVAGGAQRRRSMQPKQMRMMTLGQLDSGQPADISVRADVSFTSEEPSGSGLILAGLSPPARSPNDNLPPLERARQRSLQLSRR